MGAYKVRGVANSYYDVHKHDCFTPDIVSSGRPADIARGRHALEISCGAQRPRYVGYSEACQAPLSAAVVRKSIRLCKAWVEERGARFPG